MAIFNIHVRNRKRKNAIGSVTSIRIQQITNFAKYLSKNEHDQCAFLDLFVRTQYRTCPVRHLTDLELVPHPQNICPVHVPSGILGSWKWSPTPKMLFSTNYSNIKRNGFERKPKKTTFHVWFTMNLHVFTKSLNDPRVDTHILV